MKKQVGTGVMPGAVSFLSPKKPWGFGNIAQLAGGLSEPTQELHRMEDEEINANADHECAILGKCRSRGTEYNLPNSVNGLGAGPNNPTDLERMAMELDEACDEADLQEVGITTQRQPGSLTQRQPIDGNYFDLPGTPKRMWHANQEEHVPIDLNEPNNIHHFDDWLDDILAMEEAEESGTNVLSLARNLEKGSPNDWKSTTPAKQGRLFMAPGQQTQTAADLAPKMTFAAPKRHLGGSVKEQADLTRWYMRTASARAVPDLKTDTIRQQTEPLLLGDPELDDDVVDLPNASTTYLVKPQRWIKKEKDTDIRMLENGKTMKLTREQLDKMIKNVMEQKKHSPFASKAQQRFFWAKAGESGKQSSKWKKWAKDKSSKTDWDELPDKAEELNLSAKLNEITLKEWGSVLSKVEPFISSWIKAGRKDALRSLGEMFEIIMDEGCDTDEAIAAISQSAHEQATSPVERAKANKLHHFLMDLAGEEKVQKRWMR